jgi:hypothetical protein
MPVPSRGSVTEVKGSPSGPAVGRRVAGALAARDGLRQRAVMPVHLRRGRCRVGPRGTAIRLLRWR